MTTAELNTLDSLTAAMVMAESGLSSAQHALNNAMRARDEALRAYRAFIDSIQTTDAPESAPAKRKYTRKAKPEVAA